jgi:hypothetical protein
LNDIPDEILNEFKSQEKASLDGWVYIKVIPGMYGLPEAGSLGHDLLQERLNKEGLWKHNSKRIRLCS